MDDDVITPTTPPFEKVIYTERGIGKQPAGDSKNDPDAETEKFRLVFENTKVSYADTRILVLGRQTLQIQLPPIVQHSGGRAVTQCQVYRIFNPSNLVTHFVCVNEPDVTSNGTRSARLERGENTFIGINNVYYIIN